MLSQEQLLNTIIPDVRISKITLESAGDVNLERNPHIDHEKEPDVRRNLMTGKLERVYVGPDTGKKADDVTPIRVTVDLIVKEKLDDGLLGSWFGNQDFAKYIKLKLFQITKKEVTRIVSNNKIFFESLDKTKLLDKEADKAIYDGVTRLLGLKKREQTKKVLENVVETRIFSMKDFIGDKTNLTKHYQETDTEGNIVTTFVFRDSFNIFNSKPKHLSYFAFAYIDLKQLVSDFGISMDFDNILDPVGNVVSEVVFDNGEIIGETSIFLYNGKIWTGAISEVEGQYIGYTSKNNSDVILERKIIGNSKIQDFRNFTDLENITLDFSIIHNEIMAKKIKNPCKDTMGIAEPKTYFSDLYLARDDDGYGRFLFSIDYRKILSEGSTYGKLFQRKASYVPAVKNSAILSMKIFRTRIAGSPEIGSAPDASKKFDDNQIDELIVYSGEKIYNNFISVNRENGSLQELKNVFVENQNLFGIRHFTGVDKNMISVTDGYYKYRAELEILDSAYTFLVDRLNTLIDSRIKLNQYYLEGSHIGTTKHQVAQMNPHIDHDKEEEKVDKGEIVVGNYDPVLNRFTNYFIEKMRQKYMGNLNAKMTPWAQAVSTYLDVLRLFTDEQDFPFVDYQKKLLYFVHPSTGNPQGINMLLRLMQTLENSISTALGLTSNILGVSSGERFGSSVNQSRINKGKPPTKSLKIEITFKEIFDSSVDKETGYDFLDIKGEQDDFTSLKIITGEEYNERIEKETNKYFVRKNKINPDISIRFKDQIYTENDSIDKTSYSYLTPSRYMMKGEFSLSRLGASPFPALLRTQVAGADASTRNMNTGVGARRIIKRTSGAKKISNLTESNIKIKKKLVDTFTKVSVMPFYPSISRIEPVVSVVGPKITVRRTPDPIDPIVKGNSECEIDKEQENNINPTPLLLELAKRTQSTKPPITLSTSFKPTTFEKLSENRKININNFDIKNRESKINRLIQNPSRIHSEAFFQGMTHTTSLRDAISSLPNQIKALYLGSVQPDIVQADLFNRDVDPILSIEDEAEFRLDYRMINSVLVFKGYRENDAGEILIKEPLWEPLTLEKYNRAVGNALICRLKPYENKNIGIERDKALELPIFDEYFILKPQQEAMKVNFPKPLPPAVLEPGKDVTPIFELEPLVPIFEPIFEPEIVNTETVGLTAPAIVAASKTPKKAMNIGNGFKKTSNIGIKVGHNQTQMSNTQQNMTTNFAFEDASQMVTNTEYTTTNVINNNSIVTQRGAMTARRR